MKLAEFRALCEQEWGEARGDILGLRLTDESYAELILEALLERESQVFSLLVPDSEIEAIRSGESFPRLLNPVTLSSVSAAKGASEDSAEVRRYYAEPHPAGIPCT